VKAVTHVRSRKTHFVAEDNLTFCGKLPNENYMEGNIEDENICSVCYARRRHALILAEREAGPLKIGAILYCGPGLGPYCFGSKRSERKPFTARSNRLRFHCYRA
jgi:hypothetical protein